MGKNGGNSGSSEFKLFGRMIPLDVNECDGGQGENVVLEGDQEKASKRPSKIVPCPRCDSMDTKFCYFNNYNVNQPRHYCRKCQRYWTAGGSLRNVPIGAGRRKNKPCFGTQNGWIDGQTPIPCYKFAKDEPIYQHMGNFCETLKGAEVAQQREGKPRPQSQIDDFSDSCALNLSGQNLVKEVSVGSGKNVMFLELAEKSTHLTKGIDSGEKPSCSSSDNKTQMSTTATKAESSEVADDVACDSEKMSSTPESEPLIMSPHGQMYCWRSMPSGISGAQWCSPGTGLSPPINWPMWAQLCSVPWKPSYSCSEPKGVLGKRERDEGEIESKSGRSSSLWVPKTLRINDPGEALTSSFVENLEIESKPGSISSGGMFKAFQPKIAEADKILCADPATHSLSASVVESS